jgi:predicted nucleotidyltransferase
VSLSPSAAALARTGLPPAAIAAIQQVLAGHPAVEQAILYGSRALGRHRPASDIDLTLIGSGLSPTTLSRIDSELDDLLLPWVIDLSRFASLTHPALLAHIERVGQVLVQRACLPLLAERLRGMDDRANAPLE